MPAPRPSTTALAALAIGVVLLAACDGGGSTTAPTSVDPVPATTGPTGASPDPSSPQPGPTTPTAPSPSPTTTPTPVELLRGLALEEVTDDVVQPVDLAVRPDDGRLHVVQQGGVVRAVGDDGEVLDPPLLDVSGDMEIHSIEQGLLGMAFHPGFPDDRRVFVFHSLPDNDNVLASFEVDDTLEQVDPGTRRDLLVVDKEPDKVRHNGGGVVFGPDGLLYVSLGDAARASVNGQDPATLPGSIVRLDVDGGDPYAIPPDNPFADGATIGDGVEGAPEVWWFGLRNPWRFTFDEPTGLAWIADVGQEAFEEVNVVPWDQGGRNFGWPAREGTTTFYDDPPVTDPVEPALVVAHDDTDRGCSITGGVVYRGVAIPELDGHYLYADWCNGWIRSVGWDGDAVTGPRDWSDDLDVAMVSGFAADAAGEVLVLDWEAGAVSRIVPVR